MGKTYILRPHIRRPLFEGRIVAGAGYPGGLDFRDERELRARARHGVARRGVARRGVVWCGTVWCGTVWRGGKARRPGFKPQKKAGTFQKVPARCMYELIAELQPGVLRYAVFVHLFLVVIRVNAFRQTPRDERPFLVEAVLGVVGVFAIILAY